MAKNTIKKGDYVRMRVAARRTYKITSKAHEKEFGHCVGQVLGFLESGWPELKVNWFPSNLKYGYRPNELKKV